MAAHRVRALLMGGQACVFYGAAEFSRDTDLRTPEFLVEAAQARPGPARAEQERDRIYWRPLNAELEQLRHAARRP
jgi:hypothetical protein